jgi:hypothetical protein
MLNCAINSRVLKYTCLRKSDIISIIKNYNKTYASNLKTSGSKRELYTTLKKTLGNVDDEEIWKAKFIKDPVLRLNLQKYTYKPVGPKGKWSWLSTSHINDIFAQHSVVLKQRGNPFKFYGTVSSDYFQFHPKYLRYMYNDPVPRGLVFNTDPSHKKGQHWVAVYIDPYNNAEYFDPLGKSPNKNIKEFLSNFNLNFINRKVYQKKDGVCGIYAICFLLSKAYTTPQCPIGDGDDAVNDMRKKMFSQF